MDWKTLLGLLIDDLYFLLEKIMLWLWDHIFRPAAKVFLWLLALNFLVAVVILLLLILQILSPADLISFAEKIRS